MDTLDLGYKNQPGNAG